MKKILAVVLSLLALSAQAGETITIIYGFSAADTMANYSRTLVEEANKIQKKYTFIFDVKPGAGNSIAANYVKNTPNTILATSGAFFVRPIFYPNESYSVNDFREIMPQCNAPMSVASVKYKSWKEVPTDRPLNIGTSGLGVVSHLTASQIIKKYPNAIVVPFKSTSDGLLALVGGQVDLTVGFIGVQEKWADGKVKVNILGTTGAGSNGHPTLTSAGFSKILGSADNPHHLVVPNRFPEDKFKEIRAILFKAADSKSVRDSYAVDYCAVLDRNSDSNIQPWYNKQISMWSQLSSGVTLK
jgi:tripartite-type tricarboxylate transporter receptor subunit TctC